MDADWINSSARLPRDGEEIEFVLDSRTVAMQGTYTHQAFHSHWAEYATDRVRSWRNFAMKGRSGNPLSVHAAAEISSTLRHDPGQRHLLACVVPHVT